MDLSVWDKLPVPHLCAVGVAIVGLVVCFFGHQLVRFTAARVRRGTGFVRRRTVAGVCIAATSALGAGAIMFSMARLYARLATDDASALTSGATGVFVLIWLGVALFGVLAQYGIYLVEKDLLDPYRQKPGASVGLS